MKVPYNIIRYVADGVYNSIIQSKTGDEIKQAIEDYIGGQYKEEVLAMHYPEEYQKSENIMNKVFSRLLDDFADPEERLQRNRLTIENLQLNDSAIQSNRGKLGGLKKKLSSELAAEMGRSSHNQLTPEQKEFIYDSYQKTEGSRMFRCEFVAKKLFETYKITRTPTAIRGLIGRYKKNQR